jgi:multiple sugar transport system substrate-binding protein
MKPSPKFGRRALVTGAAAVTAASFALARSEVRPTVDTISVLSALPPDPAPPGAMPYFEDIVSAWETVNRARIQLESAAIENIRPKLQLSFHSGSHIYDLVYTAGWVPEFHRYLRPLDTEIPAGITSDVAPTSSNAVTWNGKRYGVPYTSNVFLLYVNMDHLARAGIAAPPTTWEELRLAAVELTRDGVTGFMMPTGHPAGIGGLAAHWMAFLQQAGGSLLNEDGLPAFDSDAGVAALQMMVDLISTADPSASPYHHPGDVSVGFLHGKSAMMMNWASMYSLVANHEISRVADDVATAILPAGPVGSASIDSGDAWSITANSWVPEKAMSLVDLYLHPRAQKQLFLETGALPARLSVLEDGDVQRLAPHAATVREQLRHPINSFLTPNYDAVTTLIGERVASALRGEVSPAAALREAAGAVATLDVPPVS